MRRPARRPTGSACRSKSWTVAAPTVPSPATAIFKAGCIGAGPSSRQELNLGPRRGDRAGGRFDLGLDHLFWNTGLGQHLRDPLGAFESVVVAAEWVGTRRGRGSVDDDPDIAQRRR